MGCTDEIWEQINGSGASTTPAGIDLLADLQWGFDPDVDEFIRALGDNVRFVPGGEGLSLTLTSEINPVVGWYIGLSADEWEYTSEIYRKFTNEEKIFMIESTIYSKIPGASWVVDPLYPEWSKWVLPTEADMAEAWAFGYGTVKWSIAPDNDAANKAKIWEGALWYDTTYAGPVKVVLTVKVGSETLEIPISY